MNGNAFGDGQVGRGKVKIPELHFCGSHKRFGGHRARRIFLEIPCCFLTRQLFMSVLQSRSVSASLEPFGDCPSARAELIPFLMRHFQGEGACDADLWQRRLSFWWDENPYVHAHACRGWILRAQGRLVGFLGVIPTLYEDAKGAPLPALIATSWAVDEEARHAALPMGLMLQRQARSCLLVDTTPSPEVQKLLHRWGWQANEVVRRSLVLRGASGSMLAGVMCHEPPDWPEGLRIVTEMAEVHHLHRAGISGRIQKHITSEYLRWYVSSPMREHHWVGVVDEAGGLHAGVVLTLRKVRGLPSWKVMDWFCPDLENPKLLQLLIYWLMDHSPTPEGMNWPFISLAAFPGDPVWDDLPKVYSREETVCHFHSLPPSLAGTPLRHVMAEGDWGL